MRGSQQQQTARTLLPGRLRRVAGLIFPPTLGVSAQSQGGAHPVQMGDAHPQGKAFRQRGLDRATGAIGSRLAIGFEPRTDIAPDLTGVAVAPVAQGGFGVGLEPLVQPIHGGAMQGHSGRAETGLEPSSRVQMQPGSAVSPHVVPLRSSLWTSSASRIEETSRKALSTV